MTKSTTTLFYKIGDIVSNFGYIAEVVDFHPETGDLILREQGKKRGKKWLATHENCELVTMIDQERWK